jgi:Fibronectin type III-like domain
MKVVYGEGLYIGYRHYESMKIAPLFPFGHGLSYTTFIYGEPTISSKILFEPDRITVTIPITNSGPVEGAEIVQGYIHDEKSRLPRPEKELQAFDKVFLQPGETKNATLTLDKYSVGYYDTEIPAWIAEEGVFNVLIGASSADIRYDPASLLKCFIKPFLTQSLEDKRHSKSRNHLFGPFNLLMGNMTARTDAIIHLAVTQQFQFGVIHLYLLSSLISPLLLAGARTIEFMISMGTKTTERTHCDPEITN